MRGGKEKKGEGRGAISTVRELRERGEEKERGKEGKEKGRGGGRGRAHRGAPNNHDSFRGLYGFTSYSSTQ